LGKHLGDFAPGSIIDFKFNTKQATTSAPFTLAGSPTLAAYKDNSTTQDTDGLTLTVDFDSITGMHHVRVDTSADGTFYSTGSCFDIVLAAGTVDGVSAVGTAVGSFTLGKANVASLSANAITATAIAANAITSAKIATDAIGTAQIAAGAIDAAAFAAGAITSTVIAADAIGASQIAANAITAAKIATDAIDGDALAASALTEIQASAAAALIAYDAATGADISALNNLSAAQVNAEVVDVLRVDVVAEPTGIPPASDTLANKIGRLAQEQRNRKVVVNNKITFYDDANAAIWSKTLTDDGTTYNETEGAAP
jgi:hypothetical protein